jgi:5'-deoxynucleotidase YfbR-like HD superfamily hydrolase
MPYGKEKLFQNLFDRFKEVEIVESGRVIPIIETLKNLPRSGKSTRIDKYKLNLPKRSVYDHIMSLPAQAEFFIKVSSNDVDITTLMLLLLCHDFSEVLTGDVPSFTSQKLAGNTFKREDEKRRIEEKTNKKITAVLGGETKNIYKKAVKELEGKESYIYKFFHMIDKTDPIIAIWRYIFLFKDDINIDNFLEAMNDFFIFPEAQRACVNPEILLIVKILQNPLIAREYYYKGNKIFKEIFPNGDILKNMQHLIEGRLMNFVRFSK